MALQPSKTPVWQFNRLGDVNKFGAPPNNGNRQPLSQSNTFSTQDYTGRGNLTIGEFVTGVLDANAVADQVSPLTLSATVTTIIIPPKSTSITLIGAAAFAFSEYWIGTGALTQYVTAPANTPIKLDTARISTLYLSGAGACSFYFSIM